MNMNLRELYLADNKLNGLQDSAQLGNLLKFNYNIQILDLRNNHILDSGTQRTSLYVRHTLVDSFFFFFGQNVSQDAALRVFLVCRGRPGLRVRRSERAEERTGNFGAMEQPAHTQRHGLPRCRTGIPTYTHTHAPTNAVNAVFNT